MPTYEYACTSCGHHLEVSQKFTDEPLTTCPNCAGELRKVFGSIGIVLKGSGFYKTDSRSGSAVRTPAGAKDGAGKDDGGKPAAAKETSGSGSGANGAASSPTPAPSTPAGSSDGGSAGVSRQPAKATGA